MEGGTTFHFVTDGIEAALEQCRRRGGRGRTSRSAVAPTLRQYMAAGLVDEMWLHVVPILLGSGAPLFDETTAGDGLEQVRVVEAPGVAHLKYRRAG